MDVKYLTYIITIAQEQNMTKAAEKLFVSQSSLSYYLSKLEQDLGTPLFFRTKNKLLPTPAGQLYLDAAYGVIEIKERLYQNISNLENKAHIVIATTSLWGTKMFSDIVPKLKEAFPDVTFELSQAEIIFLQNEISSGKIDFSLLSLSSPDEISDSMEILRKEEMLLAVPGNHPYVLSHPGDTIDQKDVASILFNENFLLSRKGSANRMLADQLFLRYSQRLPDHICEVNGLPLTCDMVAQGVGIAFMPSSGKSLENMIHYYSFSPGLYRYNVLLHKKNLTFNRPEQAFLELARQYFSS